MSARRSRQHFRRRPRKIRLRPGLFLLLLLLLLLWLLISWLFGRREADAGGGDPARSPTPASAGERGPDARRLAMRPTSLPAGRPPVPPLEEEIDPTLDLPAAGGPPRGAAVVCGRLVDDGNRPIAGARVDLVRGQDAGIFPGFAAPLVAREASTDAGGNFHLPAPAGTADLGLLAESKGVLHAFGWFTAAPWSVVDLGAITLEPRAGPSLLRLQSGTQPVANARAWLRPRPPATPFGTAPWNLEELPGLQIVGTTGGVIDLAAIGSGDWEILVRAQGRVAFTARIAALAADSIDLPPRSSALAFQPAPLASEAWLLTAAIGEAAPFLGRASGAFLAEFAPAPGRHRFLLPGCEPREWRPEEAIPARPERGRVTCGSGIPAAGDARPPEIIPDFERVGIAPELARQIRFLDDALFVADRFARPLETGVWRSSWRDRITDQPVGEAREIRIETGAVLELPPPLEKPARRVLAGRVALPDDEPAAGALVRIARSFADRDPQHFPPAARADAAGRFEIEGLPAGAFELQVSRAENPAARQPVSLGPGAGDRSSVAVKLEAGASIEVRVQDPDGRAWREIDVLAVDRQGRLLRSACDDQGRARFPSIAPGTWVAAPAIGRVRLPLDAWDWLAEKSGGRIVQVGGGDDRPVTLALPRARSWRVRLQVEGKSAEHVAAELSSDHVEAGAAARPRVALPFEFRPGETILIEPLFPGRHVAVAWVGLDSAIAEFEIPVEGPLPDTLVFRFRTEK